MRRAALLEQIDGSSVDVAIIGAGINGAVTSAALTAAGVRTALIDRGDFAGFTSQESSNLVWGGFKYLQSYEFRLVRALCHSRNRLIDAYPTQVKPIEFLATFDDESPYPAWLAGLGAIAYWAIGNFATARPRLLRRTGIEELEPVIRTEGVRAGLIYSDAYLPDNDARFAFGFVHKAIDRGALAVNYTELTEASFDGEHWTLTLTDSIDASTRTLRARVIVNATGPWIDRLNEKLGVATDHRIAHSKGIHLVVPRIGSGDRIFAFFDEQERLYYVIPMGERSVIGTTDTRVEDPITQVTDEEREFVLRQVNKRLALASPLSARDIIAERCGVRPLVVDAEGADSTTDWLQLSRKHAIEFDEDRSVVSVFGGKLTDCLNVGEEVVDAVTRLGIASTPSDDSWFGEPPLSEFSRFEARVAAAGVDIDALDLWRRYGMRAHAVLDRAVADPMLADPLWDAPRILKAEAVEIGENEMVVRLEDFLRRRTGLALTERADELAARADEFVELLGRSGAQPIIGSRTAHSSR